MMYNRIMFTALEVEEMVKANIMEEERFHDMLDEILGGSSV